MADFTFQGFLFFFTSLLWETSVRNSACSIQKQHFLFLFRLLHLFPPIINKTATGWVSFLARPLSSTTSLHWDYCVRRANISTSVSLRDVRLALRGSGKNLLPLFVASSWAGWGGGGVVKLTILHMHRMDCHIKWYYNQANLGHINAKLRCWLYGEPIVFPLFYWVSQSPPISLWPIKHWQADWGCCNGGSTQK